MLHAVMAPDARERCELCAHTHGLVCLAALLPRLFLKGRTYSIMDSSAQWLRVVLDCAVTCAFACAVCVWSIPCLQCRASPW